MGEEVETLEERRAREFAERVAELEGQRRWHLAEIEYNEATIKHHLANVRDIEAQLAAIKGERA